MADAHRNVNCGDSKKFMVVCDSGGSNEWRTGLRKYHLALLATEPGKEIHVYRTPHGTSKRNKAEHRIFCYITKNRAGKSLLDVKTTVRAKTAVNYIRSTKTKKSDCKACC